MKKENTFCISMLREWGPKSVQAIENIKRICEEYLPGRYQLEVVDIYQYPIFAKDGQIVAAPTLIKELPPPLRKLIGSMADTERVLWILSSKPIKKNRSLEGQCNT